MEVDEEAVPLKKLKKDSQDPLKCIICQERAADRTCTSTPDGRAKVIHAAGIRQDNTMLDRIQSIGSDKFVYHSDNFCYKRYTRKDQLDKIVRDKLEQEKVDTEKETTSMDIKPEESLKTTRTKVSPRATPQPTPAGKSSVYMKNCVICGQKAVGQDRSKFRISEDDRAKKFLKAVLHFQDEVFVRTSDLQDVSAVFGADLFCHKKCIRGYLLKYDRALEKSSKMASPSPKALAFQQLIKLIDPQLQNGRGYSVSALRDRANKLLSSNEIFFNNRDIRLHLSEHYGDDLQISIPIQVNKPAMVFLNVTVEDVVEHVRSIDPVKDAAKQIRHALLEADFGLNDRFCDSYDLQYSWNNMKIPDVVLDFLTTLFNCQPSTKNEETSEVVDEVESEIPLINVGPKDRKVKAVYQIMHYIVNNGRKRTPFHMLLAEGLHATCKSYTILSALARFGLCISYDELVRYENDMASFIMEINQGPIPVPSHFDPQIMTFAAFDNFDHNENSMSGIGGSHDTVAVLYQEKSGEIKRKPLISETSVKHGSKAITNELPCQKLREFYKPPKKPDIPESYKVPEQEFQSGPNLNKAEIELKDSAWLLGRLDLSNIESGNIDIFSDVQKMPSWSAFNSLITTESLPEMNVAFLPILPHPVTEFRTVYTQMKNFQDILTQLKQNVMPVFCDEGVYKIAREIQLMRPEEFSNIVILLGSFHMAKIVLACNGKYLQGSGAEKILTDNEVFGPNVVRSVMEGGHYVRSLAGMQLLSEAMQRLQWKEFFNIYGVENYMDALKIIADLQESVSNKDRNTSQELLTRFSQASQTLCSDFNKFRSEGREKSQTFAYWDIFLEKTSVTKSLVRADREGNFLLHLYCVNESLDEFAVMDKSNYFRQTSLYIEDLRMLEHKAPEIYQAFLEGRFVVKRSSIPFSAVAPDMCLEQTINRSSKGSSGIIGNTKRKQFVAQWNLTYHEKLSVSNVFREISGVKATNTELSVNHEFTESQTAASQRLVNKMCTYIEEKENPFSVKENTELKLHNILTRAIMTEAVTKDLLSAKQTGHERYLKFRRERLLEKSVRFSTVIHRYNLKTFASAEQSKTDSTGKETQKKKEYTQGQKHMDLATARGYDKKELFKYDLVDSNYLFDPEGFMTEPVKSDLSHELEKQIEGELGDPTTWNDCETNYIIDVMGNVRKVNTTELKTFADFCESFCKTILRVCQKATRIDFIFDSYIEDSAKGSERAKRIKSAPIEYSNIALDTELPKDLNSFWSSPSNKTQLQLLLRKWITVHYESTFSGLQIVLSGMVNEATCVCIGEIEFSIPDLDLLWEEADVRIIPHAAHCAQSGAQRIVILSADADVMVLAIHHYRAIANYGNDLAELWIRAGTRDKLRYVPIHKLALKLGPPLCRVLPAVHALTGTDITSKFGTKAAALKATPEKYLMEFGQGIDNLCAEQAEEYLVKTYKKASPCKTLDELRYHVYHHDKSKTISDLPPTSFSGLGHIQRAFYSTYLQVHCLIGLTLNPLDYGFERSDNEILMPTRNHRLLPEDLAMNCNCIKCSSDRWCVCRQEKLPCCEYCKCKSKDKDECKNPNLLLSVPVQVPRN